MNIIKTKAKGNLIVISGPSGAGKDSIVNNLKKYYPNYWVSISMTSRKPRNGEINGQDYFFIDNKTFENKIKNKELLEYAKYNDNYYGTPKEHILAKLKAGIDVILVIEIEGALKIKNMLPDTLFIFILPPSMTELRNRLIKRGTDNIDSILNRFKRAYQEINEVTKYNYVVINDNLDEATQKVAAILTSERCRVDRIEALYLNNMEEELHELLVDKDLVNEDLKI
jgi:guanylate kinase